MDTNTVDLRVERLVASVIDHPRTWGTPLEFAAALESILRSWEVVRTSDPTTPRTSAALGRAGWHAAWSEESNRRPRRLIREEDVAALASFWARVWATNVLINRNGESEGQDLSCFERWIENIIHEPRLSWSISEWNSYVFGAITVWVTLIDGDDAVFKNEMLRAGMRSDGTLQFEPRRSDERCLDSDYEPFARTIDEGLGRFRSDLAG